LLSGAQTHPHPVVARIAPPEGEGITTTAHLHSSARLNSKAMNDSCKSPQHWHPVSLTAAIPAARLLAVTLLDTRIVVWRSASGALQAWPDQCPHRGAALSLGCVKGEALQCGYHGWQFGASGKCEHAPATPSAIPAVQIRHIYDVIEAYGLIWVKLAPSAISLPPFPEFAKAHLRKVHCGPYEVATSAPRIVENFLDMAHFGFIHEGILGDAQHTEVPPYEVSAFDDGRGQGIVATQCFAWQPKSNATIATGSMVEYTYRVPAPYTSILTKIPAAQSGFEEAIALFVQPVSNETSRVWFVLAMNDQTSADETLRAFQDTIFAQDKPIVESQTPKRLPLDLRAEAHSAADKMSSAYRRYLRHEKILFGTISA
jgi:phenylpropionate dioxygenase-like ring-hydroxylating dioxygenase large terminal subunit